MKNHPEIYLTSKEAADLLGVTMQTIQNWIDKSYLKAWKTPGGHARIAKSSVEKLVRQQQVPVKNSPNNR